MRKKEWQISVCILCVLALISAGFAGFVLRQHRPEKVEAFESRYMDMESVPLQVPEGMQAQAIQDQLLLVWEEGNETLRLLTQPQSISGQHMQWQLDLAAGGKQNTIRREQWGYRVRLELRMLKAEQVVSTAETELFFEAMESDRTRLYTLCANAEGADAWQLCAEVQPLDGKRAEGSMILEHWEVWGK